MQHMQHIHSENDLSENVDTPPTVALVFFFVRALHT